MDIGNLKNNITYYEGYEDEPEITLSIIEAPEYNIHLWEGYLYDILGEPILNGKAWIGFTRDAQQFEGIFSDEGSPAVIDIPEYLDDLRTHIGNPFRYEETADVLSLIIALFEYATQSDQHIQAELI